VVNAVVTIQSGVHFLSCFLLEGDHLKKTELKNCIDLMQDFGVTHQDCVEMRQSQTVKRLQDKLLTSWDAARCSMKRRDCLRDGRLSVSQMQDALNAVSPGSVPVYTSPSL
jgi:hypothetical protein